MQRRTALFSLAALAARPARALYDPQPIPLLEPAVGAWAGTLTYRDYQQPDKMVTLKTLVTVSLLAPDELALYYVFDDGPGKTVYSYERMKFDLAAHRLQWNSGISKSSVNEYAIVSSAAAAGKSQLTFEKMVEPKIDRHTLEVSPLSWTLTKHELDAAGTERLRSRYEFAKRAA